MFGVFKTKWERAVDGVAEYIPRVLAQNGKMSAGVLQDPYCLGFLQIVGIHVASQFLEKGSGMDQAKAVFDETLKRLAPLHASKVSALLSSLKDDETYLRGRKDGDFFMGWKLLNLAPQRDGEAALARFLERIGHLDSLPKSQRTSSLRSELGQWSLSGSGHEFTICRTYSFPGASSKDQSTGLTIECTVRSSPEVNSICSDLSFRFRPFQMARESSIVLGLFTDEPKGALVEAEAISVPEESRDEMFDVVLLVHSEDVTKLLRALSSGRELNFALISPAAPYEEPFVKSPPEILAKLLLPNDQKFKSLYDQACEQVACCQDATRARQLSEGWYRRRTPGKNA